MVFNATLTATVKSRAVSDAHVFPGFPTSVLTLLFFFQSHQLLFSQAFAVVRGENKQFVSTGDRTHRTDYEKGTDSTYCKRNLRVSSLDQGQHLYKVSFCPVEVFEIEHRKDF